jgi:hypothetical protein
MKGMTLARLAVSVACVAAAGGAYAYDPARVINRAPWPANVSVTYAACHHDSFTVPASNKDNTGVATAPTKRGACLITSVNATIAGKNYPVTSYKSSGTSYSDFVLWYSNGKYVINSKHELGDTRWVYIVGNTDSPIGDYGYPTGVNPHPEKDRPH